MIKKWLALILTALLVFSFTAALAEAPAAAEGDDKAQWTVMIYLCGTDLETEGAAATWNLRELAQTKPNDAVNVVIETGGTREWHAQELGLDIASDKLQRYSFDENGYTLVEEQPLANMAAAETLTDFVSWGAKTYPAEKYLLVLWDHGGGSLRGLIQDELHNYAIMPLDQLEIALTNAKVPLEAVLMDTCLMATLETAQAVQGSAKYLIASEEIVPGAGTSYQDWMQYLYDTPAAGGAMLGRRVCDSIQQKYAELGMTETSRQLTFSVIDLAKIDAVAAAFDQMFLEAGKLLANPEEFFTFAYYGDRAQTFAYPTSVDLADLAARLRNKAISNQTAGAVIDAVADAVLYCIKGDQRSYSSGLAFYYEPTANISTLDHYARSCKSAPYLAFLDAASMGWTAPAWVYEQTPRLPDVTRENYVVETEISITADGLPKLTVTNAPHAVSEVNTVLYQYDKASDLWLKLGEDADVTGSFDEGVFYGKFPNEWFTMDGNFCEIDIVSETDSYILYNIPFRVTLENGASNLAFRMAYVFDQQEEAAEEAGEETEPALDSIPEGHFEFYGIWDRDSADSISLPSRNAIESRTLYGYPVQMLRKALNSDLESQNSVPSKAFTFSANTMLSSKTLPKGEYFMLFEVTDVFGNDIQTDFYSITWDGKKAVFSGAEVESEAPAAEEASDEQLAEDAA